MNGLPLSFLLKMSEEDLIDVERSTSPVGHDPSDEPPGKTIERINGLLKSEEFVFFSFVIVVRDGGMMLHVCLFCFQQRNEYGRN